MSEPVNAAISKAMSGIRSELAKLHEISVKMDHRPLFVFGKPSVEYSGPKGGPLDPHKTDE